MPYRRSFERPAFVPSEHAAHHCCLALVGWNSPPHAAHSFGFRLSTRLRETHEHVWEQNRRGCDGHASKVLPQGTWAHDRTSSFFTFKGYTVITLDAHG